MDPVIMFLISSVIRKLIYPLARPHLKEAIDDPESQWDDVAMGAADEVFNYKEKRRNEDGDRNRTV